MLLPLDSLVIVPVGQFLSAAVVHLVDALDRSPSLSPVISLVISFRRGQGRQKRQRPSPAGPGYSSQPHQADPAQAAGLDEMTPAGAHRVPVDSLGFDPPAPPPLQGFVYPEHQGTTPLVQVSEQKPQQGPAQLEGRPRRPVEDVMVLGKAPFMAQSHHTQRGGHGPLARGQNGADQKQLGFQPVLR